MKNAFQRKCWWPLKLLQHDETGAELAHTAMVHITVHPEKAMQDYRESAMQLLRDGQTLNMLEAMTKHGLDDAQLAARQAEVDRLKKAVEERANAVLKFVQDSVHDWRRFAIEQGSELAFSAEVRDQLLEFRDFQTAVVTALREASTGARAKN